MSWQEEELKKSAKFWAKLTIVFLILGILAKTCE